MQHGSNRPRTGVRGSARPQAGQATAEFALVLPLFVVFVLVLFQAALLARDQVLVVHASRAAVREASVGASSDRVRAAARHVLEGAEVDVGSRRSTGEEVEVRVRYVSHTDVPLVGAILPDVTLRSSTVMRVEREST